MDDEQQQRPEIPLTEIGHSTACTGLGYDPETQTLAFRVASGAVYHYAGVSAEEHLKLLNAKSIGQHFHQHIKGKYEFTRG